MRWVDLGLVINFHVFAQSLVRQLVDEGCFFSETIYCLAVVQNCFKKSAAANMGRYYK